MAITRWNRDLLGIADEMNRLVGNVFGNEARETSMYRGELVPVVDISEDQNNYYLHIELPGVDKDEVKIQYEDGLLTITGQKKANKGDEKLTYHRVERIFGKFERSFRVPAAILSNSINANFKNGLLTITLPKAEEAKPKQIDIKIKE